MNRVIRPRRLCHRGVVDASGFIIETEYPGLDVAQQRILSAGSSGTSAVEGITTAMPASGITIEP